MTSITKVFSETKTMTKRNLLKSFGNPDLLVENVANPILNLALFVFVLGGSLENSTVINYIDYLAPGVLLLTLVHCSTTTAVSVSTDLQKGIVDRFRSMPISTSSILNGHVVESVIRSIFSLVLTIVVALIFGFRPLASFSAWLAALGILILFSFTVTWFSVLYGLVVKSPEGAGSFMMFSVPLTYLSSGFISTDTLPFVLKKFAEHQPITAVVETVRRLLLDLPLEGYLIQALIWCGVLLAGANLLSISLFRKKTRQ